MHDESVLEARIRLLERGQRRLLLVCILLAICLAASVSFRAFWLPREVSAQRFLLKDAGGRTRGEWGPMDVVAGEIDGETQHASATCFRLVGQSADSAKLCAPWDPYGGPSLVMRQQTGASLDVVLDAYTVSILGRANRAAPTTRTRLVLGAWSDGASLSVSDEEGRGTHVRPDGLLIYDSTRAVVYKTPGTTPPGR
jgi:hypothetical protein